MLKYPLKNGYSPCTPRTSSASEDLSDEFVASLLTKEAMKKALIAKQYGCLTYLDPTFAFKEEKTQRSTRPDVKFLKNVLQRTIGGLRPEDRDTDRDRDRDTNKDGGGHRRKLGNSSRTSGSSRSSRGRKSNGDRSKDTDGDNWQREIQRDTEINVDGEARESGNNEGEDFRPSQTKIRGRGSIGSMMDKKLQEESNNDPISISDSGSEEEAKKKKEKTKKKHKKRHSDKKKKHKKRKKHDSESSSEEERKKRKRKRHVSDSESEEHKERKKKHSSDESDADR